MELTILLAKVFGSYLLIMGLVMFLRREYFIQLVKAFPEEQSLRFVLGMIMLVAGLFLIITHCDWSSLAAGLVSFFGWAVTIKGLLYITLSNEAMKKWVGKFNVPVRYTWGGVASILIGLYLLNFGFNLNLF